MNHAAIDLGGRESQVCIRQPDGTIVEERKYPTRKLIELIATWSPSRVVMETSSEAFRIADAAIAAGHQVRVVPGTLVRLLGVGDRGTRTGQDRGQDRPGPARTGPGLIASRPAGSVRFDGGTMGPNGMIPHGHVSVFASPDLIRAAVVPHGPGNALQQMGLKLLGEVAAGSYKLPK